MEAEYRPLAPGLWGVLVTPFKGWDMEVDTLSLKREVAYFRSVGASGLVALGVMGEGARLSPEEQGVVLDTVAEAAAGLPLVVGVNGLETDGVIASATRLVSKRESIEAVMVLVNSPNPELLARHLRDVCHEVGRGVVVQDYPAHSGIEIAQDDLAEAVNACGTAVAVKSEAPPTAPAIAHLVPNVSVPVFGGLGGVGLLDELLAGAAGAMTGFSHPEGLLETINAFNEQGFDAAWRAWQQWLPLANFEAQAGIGLALRKASLQRRGIIDDAMVRPPAQVVPEALMSMTDRHLAVVSARRR